MTGWLFGDPEEGARRRDEALDRVERGVGDTWMDEAIAHIIAVCETRQTFLVDDVWAAGLPRPREARAIGAAMTKARRLKLIEPTSDFKASAQPQCHRNPRRIWRSCIFATPPGETR